MNTNKKTYNVSILIQKQAGNVITLGHYVFSKVQQKSDHNEWKLPLHLSISWVKKLIDEYFFPQNKVSHFLLLSELFICFSPFMNSAQCAQNL